MAGRGAQLLKYGRPNNPIISCSWRARRGAGSILPSAKDNEFQVRADWSDRLRFGHAGLDSGCGWDHLYALQKWAPTHTQAKAETDAAPARAIETPGNRMPLINLCSSIKRRESKMRLGWFGPEQATIGSHAGERVMLRLSEVGRSRASSSGPVVSRTNLSAVTSGIDVALFRKKCRNGSRLSGGRTGHSRRALLALTEHNIRSLCQPHGEERCEAARRESWGPPHPSRRGLAAALQDEAERGLSGRF